MSGIKADVVHLLEPCHTCGICKVAVRSPIQADYGYVFCNDCRKEVTSSGETTLCPEDWKKARSHMEFYNDRMNQLEEQMKKLKDSPAAEIRVDFVHPLEPRHICGICKLVVKSPMQTDCGHIFCNDCLKEAMSSGETILCPIDAEKISQMFPDNACKREIQRLEVRCRYAKNNGCPWTGTLSNEDIHYIACDYHDEQCPDCGSYMMWTKLKKHAEMECPMRMMMCRHCCESIPVLHEKLHLQKDCPTTEMSCPNNCNPNHLMKRKELNKHLSPEDGDCPFSEVDCPYKLLGCSFKGSRQVLGKHRQDKNVYHQRLVVKRVYDNTQQNTQMTSTDQLLEDQLSNLSICVTTTEKEHDENAQRLAQLEERMSKFQSQYLEKILNSGAHSMPPAVPIRGTKVTMLSSSENSTQLMHRVPELINKHEELNRAVEKLMSSSVDQELRIQLLEQATHNGILVWKINEVSRRIDEGVKGMTVSLFSAPFYSDPRGYKMCARCYLNGDGMGKGTHFSLFFVVMRGLYDALLRWPFRQRVTMTLMNQSGGRHASDTFHPDVHSSSFQRPMNRAYIWLSLLHLAIFAMNGYIGNSCFEWLHICRDCIWPSLLHLVVLAIWKLHQRRFFIWRPRWQWWQVTCIKLPFILVSMKHMKYIDLFLRLLF